MSTETLLLIILIVLLVGAFPVWPYSQSWGYAPGGVFTLLLIIFLIWALAGGRPLFRSTGSDLKATVHDAGQDIESAGHKAADSIRHAVQ
jgi:hypothetical protein